MMRGVRLGVGAASAAQRRALSLTPANHACSKCWGPNSYGQLGLGRTRRFAQAGDGPNEMSSFLPFVDLGSSLHPSEWTIVEVGAGDGHTCARLENGAARALKCWGRNERGALGLGDTINRGDQEGSPEMGDRLPAVQLGTNRSAVSFALGGDFEGGHSCALLDNGLVKCWGSNRHGRLGLGDSFNRGDSDGEMGDSLPAVDLGGKVVQLAAGEGHNCALLDDGRMCAPHPRPFPWTGCVSLA